ncbi:unnamed protein product [Blumeria hordei]|uniref:Uncharacterized protein n=1 Tax=Blumeria hordei TaxID=2867405 RepID=A0A383UYI1_BLUHO|nr:unnamed protein product [Blumeria hordei]
MVVIYLISSTPQDTTQNTIKTENTYPFPLHLELAQRAMRDDMAQNCSEQHTHRQDRMMDLDGPKNNPEMCSPVATLDHDDPFESSSLGSTLAKSAKTETDRVKEIRLCVSSSKASEVGRKHFSAAHRHSSSLLCSPEVARPC